MGPRIELGTGTAPIVANEILERSYAFGSVPSVDADVRTRDLPAAPSLQMLRVEGEDAKINGMTRSLSRRLMGLNFPVVGLALSQRKIA